MKFLPLAYSFRDIFDNDNLEVDWLLLTQSVCDTIQSLCEYFMTYSTLMVDMFLKRTRGVLPTVAYTGKLRRKRKPYLGFRYIKEWGFTCWSIWKGREIYHFGRLQNSPYFCVFKYARAVKQKVWNEAENRERDWGETLFFTDFEKKTRLFCSLSFRSFKRPEGLTDAFYGCAKIEKTF